MSYQSTKTITSMVTGVSLLAAYCIYAFGKYGSRVAENGDLQFWARTMLIFIGIGIAAQIVLQIIFHIVFSIGIAVKEGVSDEKAINRKIEASIIEDEMDKLIELKSLRYGFIFAGVGFVSALVTMALGYSMVLALNIMYLSFMVGSLLEGVASLYFYGKGVSNG